MRAFAHINVDQLNGHWTASFHGAPQFGCGGPDPATAIRRLIDAAQANLDEEGIVDLEDQTREGHLEFLIPYRKRWRIPVVSNN